MTDIEIGGTKRARRAYSFDEVAIAPSRRTRDPLGVSTAWTIDAYRFELPFIAAPTDSIVSPASAKTLDDLGLLASLNVEGLWGRYENPEPLLTEIALLEPDQVTARMQQIYSANPIDPDLVTDRISPMKNSGIRVAAAMSPQHTADLAPLAAAGMSDAAATFAKST